MKPWIIVAVFAAGVIAGCMAGSPPVPAQTSASAGAPPSERPSIASSLEAPLVIDRMDMRLGTTVQYHRIPDPGELHDLTRLFGLAHIVLSLPSWPADFAPLQPLEQVPEGTDLIVVLPGYPPTREAAEAWGYVNAPLRLVVVVPGPPLSPNDVLELNSMRKLERVIAQMDEPSRSGFEQLQRPLQFRKLMAD